MYVAGIAYTNGYLGYAMGLTVGRIWSKKLIIRDCHMYRTYRRLWPTPGI